MSFTRANPGGWAVGSQLTSVQANSLDIDHANSLDKSAAGDTLAGTILVPPGAAINVTAGGGVTASGTGAINSNFVSGIRSGVVGGFQLAGGATDWPTFFGNRSRSLTSPMLPQSLPTPWTAGYGPLVGGVSPGAVPVILSLPQVHNGATLSSVVATFAVNGPHASVPSAMPSLAVYRLAMGAGLNTTQGLLSTTGVQSFPYPPSGVAWDAGRLTQQLTFTCNQNNVIDNTSWVYYVSLVDENGANSVAGNLWLGLTMNYTLIADMRFA